MLSEKLIDVGRSLKVAVNWRVTIAFVEVNNDLHNDVH